jgi:hypothetical protein
MKLLAAIILFKLSLVHSGTLTDTLVKYERMNMNNTTDTVERKMAIENYIREVKSILKSMKTKKIIKPTNHSSNGTCQDPMPAVKHGIFIKFQYIFKDLIGLMDIKDVQQAFNEFIDSSVYEAKNVLIFDSEACDVETNLTKINELSTCPWHTRIEMRENRYPMMMSQVKCNCQKCLHFNDEMKKVDANFACMPVYRLSTALIRDENCDSSLNGIYQWRPILEKISVSCVCTRVDKLFITINHLF